MQKNGTALDPSSYTIDYQKGILVLDRSQLSATDSLRINYVPYPDYLTKRYYVLDPSIIASGNSGINKLQTLEQSNTGRTTTPFEGLNTLGSISRGITVGSNQNTVVNSELDLQITGQLNDKVTIRASIQDAVCYHCTSTSSQDSNDKFAYKITKDPPVGQSNQSIPRNLAGKAINPDTLVIITMY